MSVSEELVTMYGFTQTTGGETVAIPLIVELVKEALERAAQECEAVSREYIGRQHMGGRSCYRSELLELDKIKDFGTKKELTSAMRRLAPIGLATGNHRSIRWAIEQRTSAAAEEEIRLVFGKVYDEQVKRYPHLYGDANIEDVKGLRQVSFANYKI